MRLKRRIINQLNSRSKRIGRGFSLSAFTAVLMLVVAPLFLSGRGSSQTAQGSQSATGNGARKLNPDLDVVQFVTSDISLFWQAYDMAGRRYDLRDRKI